MKKFHISDYKKGFILSLVLHGVVVLALVYEDFNVSKATPQQHRSVAIALTSFTPPQETVKAENKPQPQKKVCKEKVKKHVKPRHKKHAKKHKKEHKKHAKKHKVHKNEAPKKEYIAKTEPQEKPKVPEKQELTQESEIATVQETKKTLKNEEVARTQNVPKKSVAKVEKSMQQPSAASLEKQFVQTNFEIIRALLLQNLKYPNLAKRMHKTGVVELKLVINSQGKLTNVQLKNSSGHSILDRSALKAAELLADLDLPVPQTTARIVLPVAFTLN